MVPKKISELRFTLRKEIYPDYPVITLKIFVILFFTLIIVAGIHDYFYKINLFIIWGLVFMATISFVSSLILNHFCKKRTDIGKLTLTRSKIIIESNESMTIDISEVKSLRIHFPTQAGNIRYLLGTIVFDSSEGNELSFTYNSKEYFYLFASRKGEDLKVLEFIIGIWRKNGITVKYIGPQLRY